MGWRRILLLVVVVVAAAGGAWWAFRPQPIAVDMATLGRGTLIVTVDDEGVVQVRDTYQVSTPIGGDVQRIPLEVGDRVEAGTIVASIVPQLSGFLDERSRAEAEAAVRTAEASLTSAQSEITGAQTDIEYWKAEVARSERLLERGLTTQQAAEQARLERDRASVRLTNAQATLELRRRQLEQAQTALIDPTQSDSPSRRLNLTAPISGTVLEVSNESARSLVAGTPLLTIGDPDNLEVVVDLLSEDAVRIKQTGTNAPAWIDAWGGDVELLAQVHQVEPIGFTKVSALGVEEQRVRVHLDILSDHAEWRQLGHLYRVFVRIQVERVDDAVLVPTAALFRDGEDWAVYAVDQDRAVLRKLVLGARDSQSAEVKSGLDTGDRVILHPNDQIADATLVVDRAEMAS